ncbi:hypothetical protein appser12_20860 [Actinobacillus pleuropneumoniae serovar 12 str. 1096]|uniref:Uncharacterized protein n=1 Tax=Actinobacillus pleuropneumoniae serovar 6 str. Femo TaxID=754256 RepID=A0A828PSD2_ACTPL|nr:hypothetical protein appser2_17700 [Actinobacillus pleuropneumoniae serovar 2 str. S1536]EFM91140.1 hypothetical protein appser6_19130 [Actinobacillus pleuropneumoniae serovar 6 str. Femo]EFM99587.1 hypothetical protein appser12_20860 [Actinobacillus pleuropneumoniae serovar 12 str. 1096]
MDENFFKKVYLNKNLTVPSGNNIYIKKILKKLTNSSIFSS